MPPKHGLFLLFSIALLVCSCASPLPSPVTGELAVSVPDPTATQPPPLPEPSATPESMALQAVVTRTPAPLPTITPSPTPLVTPLGCPYLHGTVETGVLPSAAMGEQVRYRILLPPCYYDYPDQAFPTLYLFHGWPFNEWHWDNLGIDEWRDDWISRGLSGPFLIVLPGVSSDGRFVHSSGGDWSFEGFVVNELVPYVDSHYRTIRAPEGRAVGGISRGGVWSLEIAMRHQDLFAIVGGHSPALSLNRPLPQYDPFLLARQDMSGLRFFLDAGDGDWARPGTLRFRDLLLEGGADVTDLVHRGSHVDDLWRSGVPAYIAFYAAEWPVTYDALPDWEHPDAAPAAP